MTSIGDSDIFNYTTSNTNKRQKTIESLDELNHRLVDHDDTSTRNTYRYKSKQTQPTPSPHQHSGPIPAHLDPILKHIHKNQLPIINQPDSTNQNKLQQIQQIRKPSDIGNNIDNSVFSSSDFNQFHLHSSLVNCIHNKLHYVQPTTIQSLAIPYIINNTKNDILIKSETGSGKTLAYIVPLANQLLQSYHTIDRTSGIYILILLPTRELVIQIHELLNTILQNVLYRCVVCNVMGGESIKREKARLRKGCNILLCTPGRLVYHIQNTVNIKFDQVKYLVLDECDRLLDLGFENDIKTVIQHLNKSITDHQSNHNHQYQSILVSATLTSAIMNITHLLLNDPVKIGFDTPSSQIESHAASTIQHESVHGNDDGFEIVAAEQSDISSDGDNDNDNSRSHHGIIDDDIDHAAIADQVLSAQIDNSKLKEYTLPNSLQHYYVQVDPRHKLVTLASYIRQHIIDYETSNRSLKLIVFVSTCASVEFYYMLFKHCYWPDSDDLLPNKYDDMDDQLIDEHTILPPLLNIPIHKLHGNLSQRERMSVYHSFTTVQSGILFCTDVAARGLDLPSVDHIIQYDAPELTEDYIHRSGRTARMGRSGTTCLFLLTHEIEYINILKKLHIKCIELNVSRILMSLKLTNTSQPRILHDGMSSSGAALQRLCEAMVSNSTELMNVAVDAYTSWLRAYSGYPKSVRHIFVTKKLHLGHIARCFALQSTPSQIMTYSKQLHSDKLKSDKSIKRTHQRAMEHDTGNRAVAVAIKSHDHNTKKPNSRRNPLNKPNAVLSATGVTRQMKAVQAAPFNKQINTFNEFAS